MRHQAKLNNKGAKAAKKLLENPDKIIGVILLGNNLTNILITQIATLISLRLYGDIGLAIATGLLTIFILIFAELTPKTIGEMHSEKVAYSSSLLYKPMLVILYPIVFVINLIANSIIKIMGLKNNLSKSSLSTEELKTVLSESSIKIPKPHLKMLESIIDLEKATVEDIMIPRSDIYGIDLNDDISTVVNNFKNTPYTRIPVFEESIENLLGLIHIKNIAPMLASKSISENEIRGLIKKPYYIVSGTSLYKQLISFQNEKRRIGFIIDEYGGTSGSLTVEDIVEELIGEIEDEHDNIALIEEDRGNGSYRFSARLEVDYLNEMYKLNLIESEHYETLGGLIVNFTEEIPEQGKTVVIERFSFQILEVSNTKIELVELKRHSDD